MRAGVEPRVAAAHDLHAELLLLQVGGVDGGDLELAARARADARGDVAHLLVVEVQARDGVVALGGAGLFLDGKRALLPVELHHAVALGIVHVVGEDGGPRLARGRALQGGLQIVAVEDVVAQHQRAGCAAHEVAPEDEGLREAIGARLHAVAQVQAPLRAAAQQLLEAGGVLRGADDEDVADAREHQGAQRVVDHRLVVDGQELLAHGQRGRVQPGAGAAGEDEAFAGHGGQQARETQSVATGWPPPTGAPQEGCAAHWGRAECGAWRRRGKGAAVLACATSMWM